MGQEGCSRVHSCFIPVGLVIRGLGGKVLMLQEVKKREVKLSAFLDEGYCECSHTIKSTFLELFQCICWVNYALFCFVCSKMRNISSRSLFN